MSGNSIANKALEQGQGVLRLAPNWVPRSFCVPGRWIKLHPDDYYAMGGERGGIDERWFPSTTPADNRLLTFENKGQSSTDIDDGDKIEQVLLLDVVSECEADLIGDGLWYERHRWPTSCKFLGTKETWIRHGWSEGEHSKLGIQLGKPKPYRSRTQLTHHDGGTCPSISVQRLPSNMSCQEERGGGELLETVPHALQMWDRDDRCQAQRHGPRQRRVGSKRSISKTRKDKSRSNVKKGEPKKSSPWVLIEIKKQKKTTIKLGPSAVNLLRKIPWPLNLPFRRLLNLVPRD